MLFDTEWSGFWDAGSTFRQKYNSIFAQLFHFHWQSHYNKWRIFELFHLERNPLCEWRCLRKGITFKHVNQRSLKFNKLVYNISWVMKTMIKKTTIWVLQLLNGNRIVVFADMDYLSRIQQDFAYLWNMSCCM